MKSKAALETNINGCLKHSFFSMMSEGKIG
jgi:hypothetical protein